MDKYVAAEKAKEIVSKRLASMPDFADLAAFHLMVYTSKELTEMGEDPEAWVGQYMAGSALSGQGATVALQISLHSGIADMSDTIAHELGHGLHSLLTEEDRQAWADRYSGFRLGPEEFFADQLMYVVRGETDLVSKLFWKITKPAENTLDVDCQEGQQA